MDNATVPLTWVVGVALTFTGLWIPIVFALLSQARSFGSMSAKLDGALAEVQSIRSLESRVQATEGWIDRLREHINSIRNHLQTISEPSERKPPL